jgi:hypothetical protein
MTLKKIPLDWIDIGLTVSEEFTDPEKCLEHNTVTFYFILKGLNLTFF